jgi:hypothetical protein
VAPLQVAQLVVADAGADADEGDALSRRVVAAWRNATTSSHVIR